MFTVNYLDQELFFYENLGSNNDDWESVVEGDVKKIHISRKEPLTAEIEEFISCIKEDREPLVTGEHGLNVLKIANHILRSAKENKIIREDELNL